MYLEDLPHFAALAIHPEESPLHHCQQVVAIDLYQLPDPQPPQAAEVARPGRLLPRPVNREGRQGLGRKTISPPDPQLILSGKIYGLISTQQR